MPYFFICKKTWHKLDIMKEFDKKKFYGFMRRFFVGLLVLVMLVVFPTVKPSKNQDLDFIYEKFIGKKSEYQGMIEIWNIDTFEGGNVSKTKLLSQIANSFQKENKGIYFMVRNVTESECLNLLASGQKPDLFSCSYGVAESIKKYAVGLDAKLDIYENFLSAGQDENGVQLGVAWCFGSYYLISTQGKLLQAGKGENATLLDVSLSSGFVKNDKKKSVVYSLDFGCGKYSLPHMALLAYYDSGEFLIADKTLNKTNIMQSSYSAYCNFIAGKSTLLLGTVRDVFRVKNREQNGKLENVIVCPLEKFSDLVQFAFVVDSGDELKNKYIKQFAEYLISEKAQTLVVDSGLFSTNSKLNYGVKEGVMKDITPNNISDYTIPNVFLSKIEIEKSQQKLLS